MAQSDLKKQADARPGSRCDTRPSRIITDYRLSEKRSISADEMY